ncbi:hypothetical protein PSAC2689_70100 [Paraburkholderia sacchari]
MARTFQSVTFARGAFFSPGGLLAPALSNRYQTNQETKFILDYLVIV